MLVPVLVLAPFGLLLAVLSLPASLRPGRRAAGPRGRPAVPPRAHRTAERGAAAPDREPAAERQPYDGGGLIIGAREEA